MNIDREKIKYIFAEYTSRYNVEDEKVKLKIDHTYRVADLCEQIANSLCMTKEEMDFAWLTGMLHDIGRFEQLRNYGTFIDSISIDHAQYGVKILFEDGKIRDYIGESEQDEMLYQVIKWHSAFAIPEELDEVTKKFAHILRDADKIDILKVNVEVPLEEIYNVATEELRNCIITKEVMEAFMEHKTVLRQLKRTAVDHVVGHISLVFGLVYPCSFKIVMQQGYLEKIMDFKSFNQQTQSQFEKIKIEMHNMCKIKEKQIG